MGYKSQDTLGTVKGANRLDENARFNDVLNKTKNLLSEGPTNGGMQGFKSSWDDIETNPDKDGRFDDYDDNDNVAFPDAVQPGNSLRNPKRGYDDGDIDDIDPNLSFPGDLGLDEEYSDNEQNMATLKSSQIAVGKIKERGNMNLDKHPIEVKSGEETLIARFILSVEVPNKESAEANVIFNMGDGDNWEINVPDAKRVTDTLLEFGMKITQSGFQTIIGIVKSVIDASQSLDDTQKLEYLNSVVRHFRSYVK